MERKYHWETKNIEVEECKYDIFDENGSYIATVEELSDALAFIETLFIKYKTAIGFKITKKFPKDSSITWGSLANGTAIAETANQEENIGTDPRYYGENIRVGETIRVGENIKVRDDDSISHLKSAYERLINNV